LLKEALLISYEAEELKMLYGHTHSEIAVLHHVKLNRYCAMPSCQAVKW